MADRWNGRNEMRPTHTKPQHRGWLIIATSATAIVTALATILVAGLASTVSHAFDDGPQLAAESQSPGQQKTPEEQLVERFVPILKIEAQDEECGSGSVFDPAPVGYVLDQPGVELREIDLGQPLVTESPSAQDLFEKGEGFFVGWPGNPRNPGCDYDQDYLRIRGNDRALVYAHISTEPGFSEIAVQYFFFFYFNNFLNKHEGDWEKIQLVFPGPTVEDALTQEPIRVAYSGHAGGERADWDNNKLEKDDGRPVVYTATGSNASYYQEGRYLGVARDGTVFGCEQTIGPHRRVDPEVQLLPHEVTDPNSEFAWITYEGLWGEYDSNKLFRGISGPNKAQPWNEPFTWEMGLRDWSEKLPEGEVLGFDPAAPFCFIINIGAAAMNRLQSNPIVVGGAAVFIFAAAVGLFAGGAPQRVFGAKTGTRPDIYSPIVLRRARDIGQIGRASFVMYTRRILMFLAFGAAFIVIGSIATGIQAPIKIQDFGDNIFIEPLLLLTIGGLQAIVSLLVIEATVTVALNKMAEGHSPTIIQTYKDVFPQLLQVIGARLRTAFHVVLLILTIVGIPWAIHRSVSWLFVEQMVLIEGKDWKDSLSASAELVRGSWMRTLGFIFAALIVFVVPGPVIAFLMLLWASPPTSDTIYLVNGLLYGLVLAPFVSIAEVLYFFDLKARRRQIGLADVAPVSRDEGAAGEP